jgi:membrane associated rhomboid family serine protease
MVSQVQTCYRHPDRRAGVTCQRCDRPICPSCMTQAAVGFHCPECSQSGSQQVYTGRRAFQTEQPVVTLALIAINVAVFLAGAAKAGSDLLSNASPFATDYGMIGSGVLVHPDRTFELIGVAHGQWYRLFTAGFLHVGLWHIALNMLALWFLGSQLEPLVGRVKFAVVYMSALLAGSLGVIIVSPHEITVGASGAIFGLLGFAVAYQRSRGINIWQSGLGMILVLNLVFTFGVSGISIGGHVGGLIGGYVCGLILYELTPRMRTHPAIPTILCGSVGVACFVASLVVASGLSP